MYRKSEKYIPRAKNVSQERKPKSCKSEKYVPRAKNISQERKNDPKSENWMHVVVSEYKYAMLIQKTYEFQLCVVFGLILNKFESNRIKSN
jgi:hypothetical protein